MEWQSLLNILNSNFQHAYFAAVIQIVSSVSRYQNMKDVAR